MNSRLRELMLEAGYAAPELAGRALKLAELIVQECAGQCDLEAGLKYSPNSSSSRADCKQRILNHFGEVQ